MTKIITKTVEDKVIELLQKYHAQKPITTNEGSAVYAWCDGKDANILIAYHKCGEEIKTAKLYTYIGMDADNYLIPYEPETYDFYAWLEATGHHVDSEYFHEWVGNNDFDENMFKLYVDYLIDRHEELKCDVIDITPDYKTQTLAEKLKEEFAQNKLNRGAFLECVEKMFKEETCGKGAHVIKSHSSFYSQGFSWGGIRTINDPINLYINANCWKEALGILSDEGVLGYTLDYAVKYDHQELKIR